MRQWSNTMCVFVLGIEKWFLHVISTLDSVLFKQRQIQYLCMCVCASTTSHIPSTFPSLLPVYPASQVWKLADTWPRELIILNPGPITPHYPLCVCLSGESAVTIAQHESWRRHRTLMDTPQESRSTNLQVLVTLQQHTHKGGYCSGSESMTSWDEVQRDAGDERAAMLKMDDSRFWRKRKCR